MSFDSDFNYKLSRRDSKPYIEHRDGINGVSLRVGIKINDKESFRYIFDKTVTNRCLVAGFNSSEEVEHTFSWLHQNLDAWNFINIFVYKPNTSISEMMNRSYVATAALGDHLILFDDRHPDTKNILPVFRLMFNHYIKKEVTLSDFLI